MLLTHRTLLLLHLNMIIWSHGSSVSIVSDYRLDDRAIGVRSPAEVEDFSSSLCPEWLWGTSRLSNGYQGSFSWEQCAARV
jgi:hypothetical protein